MQLDLFAEPLPIGREAWERRWPGLNSRYLAWCNALHRSPIQFDDIGGAAFTSWIGRKSAEFRKANGIARDFVPPEYDKAFTGFLWS